MMMETCLSNHDEKRELMTSEVENLKRDVPSELSTLQDSQNSSIEEREHLQVYLRIRPFTSAESDNGESQDCVTIESPDTVLLKPPSLSLSARLSTDKSVPQTGQRFQFSQVYGPQTTQRELFRGTVKDMVKDVLEGGNSLVFTYGVTNAGKTFTFLGPDADAGILPRSLEVIFASIDEQVFTGMCIKPHRCREFTRLSRAQQTEEAAFKRNLFRQLKESEKTNISLLNSTNKTLLEDSAFGMTVASEDKISLEVETLTKFSVWVSFCEIYNENIHDLLEVAPSGALRRTVLRLSQDVKGNAFVKDLRWVQVNSAEEAYKVMTLGKKNQSFSSTRLNQLSSRSHSIFSIRILRIEGTESPRVHAVSELSLCDLAGSERCAKTQNKGERLKEAGNINTSLLILGKCINALKHNQQAKLLQHVPFRESKLTHYLQSFFCGRGKACMIVNINQCASMYDETLNVLKFSAVAQKVVVLSSKPLSILPHRSTAVLSVLNKSERETLGGRRRTSLSGMDSSLEDVQEDEEDEEEKSLMEDTVDETYNGEDDDENDEHFFISKKAHQRQVAMLKELQVQLKKEKMESLLLEERVREEISKEFSAVFSEMQDDYNERMAREREILEERAERRLEIFKNLIDKMAAAGPSSDTQDMVTSEMERAEHALVQLQNAQTQMDEHSKETQDKTSQTQMHEGQSLQQETQTSASSGGLNDQRGEEAALQLRRDLAEETEKNQGNHRQILELEQGLADAKELLANKELISVQQLQQLTEKLIQQEAALKQQEELREQLRTKEELSQKQLSELRLKFECREQSCKEEVKQLKTKLAEETKTLEKQVQESKEKLRQGEATSQQQLEDLKQKLMERKVTADGLLDDSKQELREQEQSEYMHETEKATYEGSKSSSSSDAEEKLKRLNSVLQAEVASLREKVSNMKETKESPRKAQLVSEEELILKDKGGNMEEKISELEKMSGDLQNKLQEKEAQVTSLQKSLQKTQEQQLEEEYQAVQEARSREVERRRELLAVAHEAIAQKDEELQKKAEEIKSLKENAKQDLEKIKGLSLDLQRKEDDVSDHREKLADYKKQVQQVQNEISSMRDEGKSLRQKLTDMEKAKKCLQSDLANRDKTIQQLKVEHSCDTKSDQIQQNYQKACEDLEAKEHVLEDMRQALMEQDDTQNQMEQVLEEKLNLIQELSSEVEKLKGMLLKQDRRNTGHGGGQSDDLHAAKQEAAQAQESLKLLTEKHQVERRKWLEEKLSLIGQAKEAEEKRNQEMRKFADDRERYTRQQSQLESLISQMAEKDETMERWRKERDTLVAALEVQLQKLLSSQAEKDKLIHQLRQNSTQPPEESEDGGEEMAKLLAALSEKEAEILRLKEELKASTEKKEDMVTQTKSNNSPATLVGKPQRNTITRDTGGKGDVRASVSSQGSAGCPSVLDSSEISTENGRTSRFPRPEMEISFSPLQPNRMALRRQGEENAVTIKISRSARKRKSGEMDKSHVFRRRKRGTTQEEEVDAQNRRNIRTKLTPKLTAHQEEISSLAGRHDSQSNIGSRKEGALQKIGEFLQSSPTLLGTKAKMMMSLMSGRGGADSPASSSSSSSLSLRDKKSKRKLYRPEISSPMDMPSHPFIRGAPEEKESSHQSIKKRLRSRMAK